jgi:hypothetical protein
MEHPHDLPSLTHKDAGPLFLALITDPKKRSWDFVGSVEGKCCRGGCVLGQQVGDCCS